MNARDFISLILIGCFLMAAVAIGEVPEAAVTDSSLKYTDQERTKGRELLEKATDACGGAKNFRDVKNYTMTCTINMPGREPIEYKEIRVQPNKSAKFITAPMYSQQTVLNGIHGWIINGDQMASMSPVQMDMSKEELKRDQLFLFSHADDSTLVVAYKGEEAFNNQKMLRLDIVLNDSEIFTIYIHPDTYLMTGMKHETISQMGPTTVQMELADYVRFGNIKFPTNIKQSVGSNTTTITDINYIINGVVADSIFVKPEGL